MSLTLEQFEEGRRIAALVVRHCGEKYFPLFDRVDREVQQRRSNSDRIRCCPRKTLGMPSTTAAINLRLEVSRTMTAECLNQHWFMSLADAREKLEAWRGDYNTVRSHSAIGNKPPAALINHAGVTSPPV